MKATDVLDREIGTGDRVTWRSRTGYRRYDLVKGTVVEIRHKRRTSSWNPVTHELLSNGEWVDTRVYVRADDRRYNGGYRRSMNPESLSLIDG